MSHIIEINNLNINYGEEKILKDINLKIEEKSITSIIGPSGCGKSTLLKSINNILSESKDAEIHGNILFHGENINTINNDELRRNIGMVFQESTPFPLTIYKNLEYPLKYYGYKKSQRAEIIENTLDLAGLKEEFNGVLGKSALKLSGGQAQRLCIARALTIKPQILLLDEPCSALDVINTKKIEDLLLALKKDYTIIIVTHNLAQAKRISDNTIFIYNGKIVESGPADKIFNNPDNELTKDYVLGTIG